ncbi:hypothetical protein JCM8547_002603 [Rhodosporidiobolus lusitaniae]
MEGRPPSRSPGTSIPPAFVVVCALVLISARLSLVFVLALPVLGLALVFSVLAAELWVTRTAERRLRERRKRGEEASGGGSAEGRKAQGKRTVPPLYFTSPAKWSLTQVKAGWESSTNPSRLFPLPGAPPFLTSAIDSLLAYILRDFVNTWYTSFSDSPVFSTAVESTIRETLITFSSRVENVEWSDILVGRILPLLTAHLETFRTAELSVHGRAAQHGSTRADDVDLFVASRYASESKGGKLHPAVDVSSVNSRPAEEAWLRQLIDEILPLLIPERELDSAAVRIIIREIVSCAVLLPIFDMLGDPDFYNRIIDDKAGAAIRDQRMVDEFRAALDSQASSLAPPVTSPVSPSEAVTVRTSARQFDSWLKGISSIQDLGDAKRLRSDVAGQIRRAKGLTDGKNLDDDIDGVKVAEWIDFIERLYSAIRKVDRRIAKLGGVVGSSRASVVVNNDLHNKSAVSLRGILLEPAAVSYLMEFLERRKHSVRAQFWLSVEGLKDPLEDVDVEKPLPTASTSVFQQSVAATASEDVRMIWDVYLSNNLISSSSRHLATIGSFVKQESSSAGRASPQEVRQVRNALFSVQGDVYNLMEEEDFRYFVQSDLYFKALADMPPSSSPFSPSDLPSSPFIVASPSLPTPLPPTRPRSRSNPQLPPLRTSPTPPLTRADSPSLPPQPASPALPPPKPYQSTFHRTETAPPQVTFHAAFNEKPAARTARRSGSFEKPLPFSSAARKISGGSIDTLSGSTVSLPALASKRPSTGASARSTTLSDSLDFLMSPPPPTEKEVERSPLFANDIPTADGAEGDGLGEGHEEGDAEFSDGEYVRVETIEAIQEALNSILATNDRGQQPSEAGAAAPSRFTPPTAKSTASLPSLLTGSGSPSSSSTSLTAVPAAQADGRRRPPPPPRYHSLSSTTQSNPSTLRTRLPSPSISSRPSPSSTVAATASKARPKAVFEDDEALSAFDITGTGSGEDDSSSDADDFDPHNVRLPAPGDLHLASEVARLAESLSKLSSQLTVVDALIRKAELTGNASELKILSKSRESLKREIRTADFQKEAFEAQASENELSSGRTRVSIPGTTIGQAEGGQRFQLYLVEVHQVGEQGELRTGWMVTRRYSAFATLSSSLAKYTPTRYLDFPSKRLVGLYSSDFIEQRRIGLERYLQALIKIPVVCRSNELRTFLSQATIALPGAATSSRKPLSSLPFPFAPGQNLVRGLYRGLTSGIDDVLGTSTTSMLDTIIDSLSQQAAEFAGLAGASVNDEDLVGQLLADQSSSSSATAGSNAATRIGEEGLTYFTAPICELFISMFELNKGRDNWLRRQAILIVLQQVLGSTLERKLRDSVKLLVAPAQLVTYISTLQNALWPDGELKPKAPPRTAAEKAATAASASHKLAALMPDVAANLIGRHNARQGARRLFAVLQNRRLNKHLIYSIVDEILAVLFPKLKKRKVVAPDALPRPLFLS